MNLNCPNGTQVCWILRNSFTASTDLEWSHNAMFPYSKRASTVFKTSQIFQSLQLFGKSLEPLSFQFHLRRIAWRERTQMHLFLKFGVFFLIFTDFYRLWFLIVFHIRCIRCYFQCGQNIMGPKHHLKAQKHQPKTPPKKLKKHHFLGKKHHIFFKNLSKMTLP